MYKRTAKNPTAPIMVIEYRDLLDELGQYYLRINTHLGFNRVSKTFVEMCWYIECDQAASMLVAPVMSHNHLVAGNKPYNVMQTLYDALWALLDAIEADIRDNTAIAVFPA